MAELSAETGASTATLKYYMREGVLPTGNLVSRTESSYDDSHVARVRLIRALAESGGLPLSRIKSVLAALDSPPESRHELLGVAQAAIDAGPPADPDPNWTATAEAFIAERGWRIEDGSPLVATLGERMRALVAAGIATGESGDGARALHGWADAAEKIAEVDVDLLPREPAEALRYAIVATVLSDPLLITLRRLADQARSARTNAPPDDM
ncbi:MerR family transcriptional regulator [Tsukamurella sp. 8F]|uniref:MerR family transcriptional regulator n=1 Tax=Tsukamurella sp. 8F TaxID=3031961 RepID=UPI0023B8BCF0|nr:MerR family transcriptional regulator [Tsukamurella sp. 8F]MDF0585951.1 MerR family transcriptional regulator [Tsukamurella sp. 8F]